MKFKKTSPLFFIFSFLSLTVSFASPNILAKVNGKDITIEEYKQLVTTTGQEFSDKDISEGTLDDLVALELMGQDAVKNGVDKDPKFIKEYENIKNVLLREFYLKKIVEQQLTEDKIKAEYDNLIKSYQAPYEYKAAHILVDDEKKANELYKQILKDKNKFSTLAKENSKDSSASQGGDLGYFMSNMMVEPFAKSVESLKIGEISKPVKTEFGWHIIQLNDKRKKPAPKFETMKPRIKAQMAQKIISEHIDGLKKSADIKILFKK